MSEPTIPPPSEEDARIDLKGSYRDACEDWLHREAGLIRRCHAAESQLTAIRTERDELREQVAKLRAALQRAEWAQLDEDGNWMCPVCDRFRDGCGSHSRHDRNCAIAFALAATAPKEPAK